MIKVTSSINIHVYLQLIYTFSMWTGIKLCVQVLLCTTRKLIKLNMVKMGTNHPIAVKML